MISQAGSITRPSIRPMTREHSSHSAPDSGGNGSSLLKIGDFARLADTNLRTLRYYEELGLLAPASRSQGGFRYYRRTDVNRVHMIRDLQELGLQLDRIRELMAARENGEEREPFLS